MKINFGCGRRVLDGFYNVDAVHNAKAPRAPELIYAAEFDAEGALLKSMPLVDSAADEVHAYHVLEHVYEWEAPALVGEWRRVLKPGGRLVLELPSIELAAKNLLAGGKPDQMHMWPLYGDPMHRDPFMCHRWGYTPRTLEALLLRAGFGLVAHAAPQTHGARRDRDMRVETIK